MTWDMNTEQFMIEAQTLDPRPSGFLKSSDPKTK